MGRLYPQLEKNVCECTRQMSPVISNLEVCVKTTDLKTKTEGKAANTDFKPMLDAKMEVSPGSPLSAGDVCELASPERDEEAEESADETADEAAAKAIAAAITR